MEFLVCRINSCLLSMAQPDLSTLGSVFLFSLFSAFISLMPLTLFYFQDFALSVSYPQNAFPPKKCWSSLQSWPKCYFLHTVFGISLPRRLSVTALLCSHCVFIASVLLNLSDCLWASQSLPFKLFLCRNNVLSLTNSKHFQHLF